MDPGEQFYFRSWDSQYGRYVRGILALAQQTSRMNPTVDVEAGLQRHGDEDGLGGSGSSLFEATEHVIDALAFATSVSLDFDFHAQEQSQRDGQPQRDSGVREQGKVRD